MILAGDIGGTKVRLALFTEEEVPQCIHEEKFASRDFGSFGELLRVFYKNAPKETPSCVSLGIAGPVQEGVCRATNLPWVVSSKELQRELKIERVYLINDLEANAWGLRCLPAEELFVLNRGVKQAGNQALISAGTGLGEAGLYFDGKHLFPFASEGGHCDFGPTTDLELELFQYLRRQYKHVSYERVLSGSGLFQVYRFFVEEKKCRENAAVAVAEKEPQRVITEQAVRGECPTCVKACRLFLTVYGAEAANLALKFMAVGGVFIGGGIAPQMVSLFQEGDFMKAFVAKGRFAELLGKIPVKVVLNDKTALIGAVRYAQEAH
ncbi:MAG: glucokinase [Verrucomicrobia bacterium]|nr:glucokinase [Verrucomicrobiota bacterium]